MGKIYYKLFMRKFLKLEGTRLYLILSMPFNPEFKIDVTCVYHFALGSIALSNDNKEEALLCAEKAGIDIVLTGK